MINLYLTPLKRERVKDKATFMNSLRFLCGEMTHLDNLDFIIRKLRKVLQTRNASKLLKIAVLISLLSKWLVAKITQAS